MLSTLLYLKQQLSLLSSLSEANVFCEALPATIMLYVCLYIYIHPPQHQNMMDAKSPNYMMGKSNNTSSKVQFKTYC